MKRSTKEMSSLTETLQKLASIIDPEYGNLRLETDPTELFEDCCNQLISLRKEVDNLSEWRDSKSDR